MHPAGPIETITVLVDNLDEAADSYARGVGLCAGPSSEVPESLVRTLPVLQGRRSIQLVTPGDDRPGAVRLVEVPGVLAPQPLTTIGWAAAELIVADVDEATQRARAAGLRVLAEPAPVGAGGGLRAAQVRGPGGEALYLTQVDRAPGGFELPHAIAPVGRVFIAVLGSRDLELSRGALEQLLAAAPVTDHPLPVRALNAALGLPAQTLHRVSSLQLAGASAVEIDQYPPDTVGRSAEGRGLAGGIACVSIRAAAAAQVAVIPAADGALLELLG